MHARLLAEKAEKKAKGDAEAVAGMVAGGAAGAGGGASPDNRSKRAEAVAALLSPDAVDGGPASLCLCGLAGCAVCGAPAPAPPPPGVIDGGPAPPAGGIEGGEGQVSDGWGGHFAQLPVPQVEELSVEDFLDVYAGEGARAIAALAEKQTACAALAVAEEEIVAREKQAKHR